MHIVPKDTYGCTKIFHTDGQCKYKNNRADEDMQAIAKL